MGSDKPERLPDDGICGKNDGDREKTLSLSSHRSCEFSGLTQCHIDEVLRLEKITEWRIHLRI